MALLLFAARRAIGNAVRLLECAGEAVSDMIQLFLAPIIFGTSKCPPQTETNLQLSSWAATISSLDVREATHAGYLLSDVVFSFLFSLQPLALVLDRGLYVHRLCRDSGHYRGEERAT